MEIDYSDLKDYNIADILFITATPLESEALHKEMKSICEDGLLVIHKDKRTYYSGSLGGYNIIHCQCGSMGTQDKDSSILITKNSLHDWPGIKAVIMVGIAFGMYDDDENDPQHFSDVLVAEKIFPYENQRRNGNHSINYRGRSHYSSNELLNAFSDLRKNWSWKNLFGDTCKIILAPILSGEKLVDDLEFRNELRSNLKGYKGGEMEGAGFAAACEEMKKPWILVKAICDFGDGKKGEGKNEKQRNAADAAVDSCKVMLMSQDLSVLIERKNDFFYRPTDFDSNKVFFINYDSDKETYYLKRQIDEDILPFIRSKNCWVYGKSGTGKSTLLSRSMISQDINYIYVDCGLCAENEEMAVFVNIVEEICEIKDINCSVDATMPLQKILKFLSKLLRTYYLNSKLYFLIDEIPFDFDSEIFRKFALNLCKAIEYIHRHVENTNVLFMLSSISSPVKTFNNTPNLDKHQQHIKFIELGEWNEEDCCRLIDLLTEHANLKWDNDISIKEFAKMKHYSPREIKNTLKELCSINVRILTRDIIDKINL